MQKPGGLPKMELKLCESQIIKPGGKMNVVKIFGITIACFILAYFCALQAGVADNFPHGILALLRLKAQGEDLRQSFKGVQKISVMADSSDIKLSPSADGTLEVIAPGTFFAKNENGKLFIGEKEKIKSDSLRLDVSSSVEIRVPASVQELELQTSSGDIRAEEKLFPLKQVLAKTESGDLRLEIDAQNLQLESSSGSLEANGIIHFIQAASTSGEQLYYLVNPDPSLSATSDSGDIAVETETDPDAAIFLTTESGDIMVDDNLVESRSWKGKKTKAPGKISVKTGSGNISLNSDQED